MKKFIPFVFASTVLALVGCEQQAKEVTAKQLEHHRYVLETVDGNAVPAGTNQPEISFGEKLHISGSMCNRFTGPAKLKSDVLQVDQLAMTRMICQEKDRDQLDRMVETMLTKGAKVSLTDTHLTLKGDEHTLIYKLADLVN